MYLNEQNPVDIFMADASDPTGETGMAGLVAGDITVHFSKSNANFAPGTGVVTVKTGGGNGEFRYTPAAGEQDTQGQWGIRATAAGCLTWRDTHEVVQRPYAAIGMAAPNIDTQLAAIKAKTDNLPSDPADASDLAASLSAIASTLNTIASYVDTEVAAIKAKTDNLPVDPADASDIATATTAIQSALSALNTALGGVPAAVLLAAEATPIKANMVEQVNVPMEGDGTDENPWRAVGT